MGKIYSGSTPPVRPPPPPPLPNWHKPPPPDRPGWRNAYRALIIVLTLLGLFFALHVVTELHKAGGSASDISTGSGAAEPGDEGPELGGGSRDGTQAGRVAAGTASSGSEGTGSGKSASGGTGSGAAESGDEGAEPGGGSRDGTQAGRVAAGTASSGSEKTGSGKRISSRGRTGEIEAGLAAIESDLEKIRTASDTTVYERICGNVRNALSVQLTILRNMGGETEIAFARGLQKELEYSKSLMDPPYYTHAIAYYARKLAEASVEVASMLAGGSGNAFIVGLREDMQAVRDMPIEGTSDAAFVTAQAMLSIGFDGAKIARTSVQFEDIGRTLRAERAKEQHIVRATEAAHRTMCEALTRSLKAWDSKSAYSTKSRRFEIEREQAIRKAADPYNRIDALTSYEARILVLIARSIESNWSH